MFFKTTKFTLLKCISFHFKTPTKQILVVFRTKLGKSLICQKSSANWESYFIFIEKILFFRKMPYWKCQVFVSFKQRDIKGIFQTFNENCSVGSCKLPNKTSSTESVSKLTGCSFGSKKSCCWHFFENWPNFSEQTARREKHFRMAVYIYFNEWRISSPKLWNYLSKLCKQQRASLRFW